MASIRSLHTTKAAKRIAATTSIVDLAKLEVEELVGSEAHRPSLVSDYTARARVLVAAGVSEDQHVEVLEILDGVSGSLILAALEGDSQGDGNTGPADARDGSESPSSAPERASTLFDAPPRPAAPKAPKPNRRPIGRLVRTRGTDGKVSVSGFADQRGQ